MMQVSPRVSVIIPTFNRRDYLPIALDSVLAQTYTDYEIVIIDDGSTDDTRDILAPYEKSIRYFYQENLGIAAARNRGIEESRGTYLALLDSDDYWLPGKLACQVEGLEKNPQWGMVATRCSSISPDGRFRRHNRPGKSGWILTDLFKSNFIRTSSAMITRQCLEQVGLFDTSLPECEEYDLWLRIAHRYPIGFITQPLTVYTDNPHGVSTDSLAGRHVRIRVLDKEYLRECLPPALYRRRMARNYHYLGRHYLRRGRRSEGKNYLRQAAQLNPLDLKNLFHYLLNLFP
jgi:glycosyltransferase involved in cell wall biosynthesis